MKLKDLLKIITVNTSIKIQIDLQQPFYPTYEDVYKELGEYEVCGIEPDFNNENRLLIKLKEHYFEEEE